jgi:hypothetical protein
MGQVSLNFCGKVVVTILMSFRDEAFGGVLDIAGIVLKNTKSD